MVEIPLGTTGFAVRGSYPDARTRLSRAQSILCLVLLAGLAAWRLGLGHSRRDRRRLNRGPYVAHVLFRGAMVVAGAISLRRKPSRTMKHHGRLFVAALLDSRADVREAPVAAALCRRWSVSTIRRTGWRSWSCWSRTMPRRGGAARAWAARLHAHRDRFRGCAKNKAEGL